LEQACIRITLRDRDPLPPHALGWRIAAEEREAVIWSRTFRMLGG
jgi:hypothetical protein